MDNKLLMLFLLFLVVGCQQAVDNENNSEVTGMLKISSPAFVNNGMIPDKYTCKGENVSPELKINNIPDGTKSMVLIVDDPDASMGTWVHWTLWNIPLINEINEDSVPIGAVQGLTNFGDKMYGGPCPPSGTHRYFFKLYALDANLALKEGASKSDVEKAMKGHVIEKAEIVGLVSH